MKRKRTIFNQALVIIILALTIIFLMLAYQQGRNTTKTEPVGSAITYFVEADPEEADSGADDNTEIAPILVCGNAGCKWDP